MTIFGKDLSRPTGKGNCNNFFLFIFFEREKLSGEISIFETAFSNPAWRSIQTFWMKRASDSCGSCPTLAKRLPKREDQEGRLLAEYLAQASRRLVDLFPAVLVLLVEVKYHQRCIDLPHSHLISCQRMVKRSRDIQVRNGKGSGEEKKKSTSRRNNNK